MADLSIILLGAATPLLSRVHDVLSANGCAVVSSASDAQLTVYLDESNDPPPPARADVVVCVDWSPQRCQRWTIAGATECIPADDASLADLPAILRLIHRRGRPRTKTESAAVLQTLLDHTPALLCWVDTALRYQLVSAALARFDGRDPASYPGMLVSEVSPWAGVGVVGLLQRAMNQREPIVNVDLRFRLPSSNVEQTCIAGFYPIINAAGAIDGVAIVILPQATAPPPPATGPSAAAAVLSVGVHQATVDGTGWFMSADESFAGWLGYTDAELRDHSLHDLVHPQDLRTDTGLFDWMQGRPGTYSTEQRWIRNGGDAVAVRVGLSRDFGPAGPITLAVLDLSDTQRAQDLLRRSVAETEAAIAAKDRFLAVLSHELRTPLTPVLATVFSIEQDPAFPGELRGPFELIRRNVELEARLIDDLLDLTRITKGNLHLNLEMVDVHTLLKQAVDLCRHDAATKAVFLGLQLDAKRSTVRADPARLKQVFWNLIRNAIKFTPSGGTVAVRSVDAADHQVRLMVTDTGVGMEPEAVGRVFSAFEQEERTVSRQFGGLGLGLTISKALVERHGGTLSVDSPGKHRGTTFTIMLQSTPSVPTPPSNATPGAPRLRILIVEDHEDTVRAMKRLLERSGYEVNAKNTVRDAVEAVQATPYDVLISDIGLPDGSGTDLIRQVRHAGSTVKAIAISGFGMEEDIRRSKEAGFQEHLTKPVNFARLQQMIASLTNG